jgi:hypothetical protein
MCSECLKAGLAHGAGDMEHEKVHVHDVAHASEELPPVDEKDEV